MTKVRVLINVYIHNRFTINIKHRIIVTAKLFTAIAIIQETVEFTSIKQNIEFSSIFTTSIQQHSHSIGRGSKKDKLIRIGQNSNKNTTNKTADSKLG